MYVQGLKTLLQEHGNPAVAEGQMDYMRRQFAFLGLKMPVWTALAKQYIRQEGIPEPAQLREVILDCMNDEYREMHYFALYLAEKSLKKQEADFIYLLEALTRINAWWDTVDWISKLMGLHFQHYPQLIQPITRRWMDSNYLWLQRCCLIFQRFYRDKTDSELLFGYIRELAHSKEFFLQKGAGWALRDYSKSNPDAVRTFIETTKLASLTKREGGKYIA
jgi:3-methyladenine DNA glycosylase AlkD